MCGTQGLYYKLELYSLRKERIQACLWITKLQKENLRTKCRCIKKLMIFSEDCAIWGENKDAPEVPLIALTTFP